MTAVDWGWRKLVADPLPWVAIMLITLVISSVLQTASDNLGSPPGLGIRFDVAEPDGGWRPDWWWGAAVAGSSILGVVYGVLTTVIQWLLTAWAYCAAADVADGRRVDIGGCLRRLDPVPVVVVSLLTGVLTFFGMLLLIIPGLIVTFFLWFALPVVINSGQEPVQAIRTSAALVSANIGSALTLAAISVLMVIAGFLACFVGLLVALPVVTLATTFGYRQMAGLPIAA